MSYKPEESVLIAYLYGELSDEESRKVEAYLSENEEARVELDELKDTRSILGKLPDKEVSVPSFVFDESPKVVVSNKAGIFQLWRKPLAIAASISLIIFIGYLSNANFSIGEGGVQLSFGTTEVEQEMFTKEDVQQMIQAAVSENNRLVNQKLDGYQNDLTQMVSNNGSTSGINQDQIDDYMENWRQQSIETLAGLLEASELSQRKYTDDLLRELAVYLDIQRQNDLNVIQTRFDNLIDDAELNQMQTNRILTNLLSNSDQPSNQY